MNDLESRIMLKLKESSSYDPETKDILLALEILRSGKSLDSALLQRLISWISSTAL